MKSTYPIKGREGGCFGVLPGQVECQAGIEEVNNLEIFSYMVYGRPLNNCVFVFQSTKRLPKFWKIKSQRSNLQRLMLQFIKSLQRKT
jgi:hypothetical protein